MWSELRDALIDRLTADPSVQALLPEVEAAVSSGSLSPASATRRLLGAFGGGHDPVPTR